MTILTSTLQMQGWSQYRSYKFLCGLFLVKMHSLRNYNRVLTEFMVVAIVVTFIACIVMYSLHGWSIRPSHHYTWCISSFWIKRLFQVVRLLFAFVSFFLPAWNRILTKPFDVRWCCRIWSYLSLWRMSKNIRIWRIRITVLRQKRIGTMTPRDTSICILDNFVYNFVKIVLNFNNGATNSCLVDSFVITRTSCTLIQIQICIVWLVLGGLDRSAVRAARSIIGCNNCCTTVHNFELFACWRLLRTIHVLSLMIGGDKWLF